MDHKWGHYVAIKKMVHFAETAALVSLILFYVHLCVRVGYLNCLYLAKFSDESTL